MARYCIVKIKPNASVNPVGYIAHSWSSAFAKEYTFASLEAAIDATINRGWPRDIWQPMPVPQAVCRVLRSRCKRDNGILIDGTVLPQ